MAESAPQPKSLSDEELAQLCVKICTDRKAEDIVLFDLRGESLVTDFCLICSGNSEPHIRAISNHLAQNLAEHGVRPSHIDGAAASHWIVMDYGTILVHIFHPKLREFYRLEELWERDRIKHDGNPDENNAMTATASQ